MAGPGTKAQRERMTVFEAYERARRGPKVDEAVWNFEIVRRPPHASRRSTGSRWTRASWSNRPEMMKRIYKAGLEMLVEWGLLHLHRTRDQVHQGGSPLSVSTARRDPWPKGSTPAHVPALAQGRPPPLVQVWTNRCTCAARHCFGVHQWICQGHHRLHRRRRAFHVNGFNPGPDAPCGGPRQPQDHRRGPSRMASTAVAGWGCRPDHAEHHHHDLHGLPRRHADAGLPRISSWNELKCRTFSSSDLYRYHYDLADNVVVRAIPIFGDSSRLEKRPSSSSPMPSQAGSRHSAMYLA